MLGPYIYASKHAQEKIKFETNNLAAHGLIIQFPGRFKPSRNTEIDFSIFVVDADLIQRFVSCDYFYCMHT